MTPPEDLVQIGHLKAPYGLQGWFWVYAETDPVANVFDYQPWWVQTPRGWQTLTVKRWRTQGKGVVACLNEVPDRTAAEALSGSTLWMPRQQLPVPADNEYYWSDLIGLSVYGWADDAVEPVLLGNIAELFETGANDVIVVHASKGSVDAEERLIPWHKTTIRQIDVAGGRMDVNWGADY
jgi:16S rRNA processing protein RimM